MQLFIYNKAGAVFLHARYRAFFAATAAAAAASTSYKGSAKVYCVPFLYYYIKRVIIIINITYIFGGFQICGQLFAYYIPFCKIICRRFNNLNF